MSENIPMSSKSFVVWNSGIIIWTLLVSWNSLKNTNIIIEQLCLCTEKGMPICDACCFLFPLNLQRLGYVSEQFWKFCSCNWEITLCLLVENRLMLVKMTAPKNFRKMAEHLKASSRKLLLYRLVALRHDFHPEQNHQPITSVEIMVVLKFKGQFHPKMKRQSLYLPTPILI